MKRVNWTLFSYRKQQMEIAGVVALAILSLVVIPARAQDAKTSYPSMAPLETYLMDRNDEIALARSAAPDSVSRDAEVQVLTRQGYQTAVKGKNGFVCLIERSWTAGIDDPDFWNPRLRGPICFNAAAARSYLPLTLRKTELVLAGRSKTQMFDSIGAALKEKKLPAIETGAMCFMMSKQGYLSSRDGHWHPHLMFFVPTTDTEAWGAGLPGSPLIGFKDVPDQLTIFMVPVGKWSDGTPAPPM